LWIIICQKQNTNSEEQLYLSVIDVGAGGEVDDVCDELFLGQPPDEAVRDEGLASSAWTDHSQRKAFGQGEVEEEGLLNKQIESFKMYRVCHEFRLTKRDNNY
jgi:hypothetical protein